MVDITTNMLTKHLDFTMIWRNISCDDFEQLCLAAAVSAYHTVNLSFREGNGHILKNMMPAIGFADVVELDGLLVHAACPLSENLIPRDSVTFNVPRMATRSIWPYMHRFMLMAFRGI